MNANLQAVEVVVPVHNEERTLQPNIELLLGFLREEFPFSFGAPPGAMPRRGTTAPTTPPTHI